MELTEKLLKELQKRLKIGSRRGVHLNAIPANSRYKFDLSKLSHIDKNLPDNFINALLSSLPLRFRISWKENVPDLNSLFEEEQVQLVKITKAFENLINQTEAIESEKGINTFGFGFPILVRRDKVDNKLTVAPIIIWSLKIKRTKEFNTWEIHRNDEDAIYVNEVLINHLESDSNISINQISNVMLEDGLISHDELIEICCNILKAVNTTTPHDLSDILIRKLKKVIPIGDKSHYEKLPLNSTNSFVDFGGLFSIFEVQKQNVINDYSNLMELKGLEINLEDLTEHHFQPISSVETDPSQQSILHSLESTRNLLIQGPPGTGKSQTLTAVLINALENGKKSIVVCEKITALEVLEKALNEKGLQNYFVVIRDVITGRRLAVNSVRERVDNSDYKRYRYKYSKDSLDSIISKAKNLIVSINNKHQKLGAKLLGDKSWTDLVGSLLSELKAHNDDFNLNIDKSIFTFSADELNSLIGLSQKGQKLYHDFEPIEAKSFINPVKLIGDNPYAIEEKIDYDFVTYSKQLEVIKLYLESNRVEYFNLRNSELQSQIELINANIEKILSVELELKSIVGSTKKSYCDFRNEAGKQQLKVVSEIIEKINRVFKRNENNQDLLNENKLHGLGFKILSIFSSHKKHLIADHFELRKEFETLQSFVEKSKDLPKYNFKGNLSSQKLELEAFELAISNAKKTFKKFIEDEFDKLDLILMLDGNDPNDGLHKLQNQLDAEGNAADFTRLIASIDTTFKDYIQSIDFLFQSLEKNLKQCKDIRLTYHFGKSFQENKKLLSKIEFEIRKICSDFNLRTADEFNNLSLLGLDPRNINLPSFPLLKGKVEELIVKINEDEWTKEKINFADLYQFITDVELIIQTKKNYFEDADLFLIEFKWFQFYNSLSDSNKVILSELKTKDNWKRSFLIFYLNTLLKNFATIDLPSNDEDLKELDETLSGLGVEQLRFIKQYWYSKQIDATREFLARNNDLSVENLYLKKQGTKNKRLSLRQIVQFNPDLFTTFFPIILTSPDVASNLFKGMNGYFDIIMFDEASQLRIEDNLPALLKGKQIIIAGDEHQMPPSNYFSKVFDGSIEDEDELEEEKEPIFDKEDVLLSCESLLDFGSELNFQRKYLDFHYRSRHPFLIDFSNYAFYNQRLKPLPNKFDYLPIKYIQVNGTFSDHTNEAEAEMVLSIIDKNINRLPDGNYPSLGIATFNITQRNLIKSKILERQKFSKYEEFNNKIQELEENGMFIKNLENIQGDERDVIIISTTYGIGKDRKFAQRFGPINHSKGYKLLNVIITRAKFKVYVCSSIPEKVFMNYKEYLVTEGANNKRAVFYAYLAYCKAVSEKNSELRLSVLSNLAENTTKSTSFDPFVGSELESPFEEEVYQALVDHFGSEKLIPQAQFAGFRIDIVYDPRMKEVPRIAIECDGAKYHSSKEAYLYDRHRQKILEDHGFVFHRIWSTNWWRNSNSECKKLIEFIKKIEASNIVDHKDDPNTAFAFTDNIDTIENYISQSFFIDEKNSGEIVHSIQETKLNDEKDLLNAVKLGSKVQVKYMNNGKDIVVHLVSTENNKNTENEIHHIYYKSPLGTALLNHVEGDIVKIGNLDNFVEIIKITNFTSPHLV